MTQFQEIMGMPITITIHDKKAVRKDIDELFSYFHHVDTVFSTYKLTSEIQKINRKEITCDRYSTEVQEILSLAEKTKKETQGYFDITRLDGTIDPSGIVKGWAIWHAAHILLTKHYTDFYINAGGDIQVHKENLHQGKWRVGIQNPWNLDEIVKIVGLTNEGIATSGVYKRGTHIYNPLTYEPADEIASLTVIGPNVYEADRFATAAFAMGKEGIHFIEQLDRFEGYMIDTKKQATYTSQFNKYVVT